MAALRKLGGLSVKLFAAKQPIFDISRCVTTVIKEPNTYDHWRPRPYPKTEEERRISAEIYHMHPAEYKLFPEDHWATVGDFPAPPETSYESRDPYYPWDFPGTKRSFHETYNQMMVGSDYTPFTFPRDYTSEGGSLAFILFMSILALIYTYSGITYVPAFDRQLPEPGVVHYTFEPKK